jgi:hypothetical protein
VSQSWTISGITVGTLGQRDALRAATGEDVEGILVLLRGGTPTLEAIELVLGEITEPYVDPDPPADPAPPAVKLYRYVDANAIADISHPPHTLDYITGIDGRLHPTNSIIVDGEIRRTDYYASATPPDAQGIVTYDDLVIREDFAYTRDSIGFARARVQTITWFTEDDEPHPETKQRLKFYENDESLREGQRRRRNITDTLSMNVTGWLVATQAQHASMQARIQMGRDFMAHHKLTFDMYADASDPAVLYAVRDDVTHPWLDDNIAPSLTVREYVLDTLNIWNLTL